MNYEFNKNEVAFLRDIASTPTGKQLIALFERMKVTATDVSNIPSDVPTADLGSHVEGRKIVKKLLEQIVTAMKKPEKSSAQKDLDDFE